MKILRFFSLVFLIVLLNAGCIEKSVNSKPSTTPERQKSPAVSTTKGGFHITLIYEQNGQPVRLQEIYLAEMIPVEGQLKGSYVPALDRTTAPGDESNDKGEVVISLVPPGKYALAIFSPLGPILVKDSDTNTEITLDIVAGEINDLGLRKVLLDPTQFEPSTK
jgi:hypothetical protein